MKLREFLQKQGFSRRQITANIDAGRVFVNREKVISYNQEIKIKDIVKFENKDWEYNSNFEKESEFIILHKPIGYVCSKSDPFNKTIYKLLPKEYSRYYYVGRLDKSSRGLVLLTNDAKIVNKYEHPRYGIEKEYLLLLNKQFKKSDLKTCVTGIIHQGDRLKAKEIEILTEKNLGDYSQFLLESAPGFVLRIVLNEGKKRHIRRMMESLGYKVLDLIRIREGEFELGDLKEGDLKIL